MAREGSDENLRLWHVTTIANTTAPTAAEINAGVDLTSFLLPDGLDTPLPGKTLDTADVSSLYDSTGMGSYGGQPITGTFFRDDVYADDDAFTTLTRGTVGFWVVCRFFGAGTGNIAAAAKVEVWPVRVISRESPKIARNEAQKIMVTCAVTSAPKLDQTVA